MPRTSLRRFVRAAVVRPLLAALGALALGAPAASTLHAQPAATPADAAAPLFTVERHGAGRPMILVPGLSSSGEVWDGLVARYEDTHELHVLTLAGFAGVPPVDRPRFLESARDAIVRYARERGLERPVIVGHSLGGMLALWVAAAEPDLPGAVIAVDGVPYLAALMDSSATPASMQAQATAAEAMFASFGADQMVAQARLAVMGGIRDTALHAAALAWSRTSHPPTVGRAVAELLTTDLRDTVAAIRAPVLLVAAAGDAPADQHERVRARYAAQLRRVPVHGVVVADARHFVMLDAPDFLHETMDAFLAAHLPAAAPAREGGR